MAPFVALAGSHYNLWRHLPSHRTRLTVVLSKDNKDAFRSVISTYNLRSCKLSSQGDWDLVLPSFLVIHCAARWWHKQFTESADAPWNMFVLLNAGLGRVSINVKVLLRDCQEGHHHQDIHSFIWVCRRQVCHWVVAMGSECTTVSFALHLRTWKVGSIVFVPV